jgi:hypothetical protein
VDATVTALRARLPGTLIGISTGAWIERDDDRRLTMVAGWRELPDHASVNLSVAAAPKAEPEQRQQHENDQDGENHARCLPVHDLGNREGAHEQAGESSPEVELST